MLTGKVRIRNFGIRIAVVYVIVVVVFDDYEECFAIVDVVVIRAGVSSMLILQILSRL